jgi:hypothetical protein
MAHFKCLGMAQGVLDICRVTGICPRRKKGFAYLDHHGTN